jgi:hypothetical protein
MRGNASGNHDTMFTKGQSQVTEGNRRFFEAMPVINEYDIMSASESKNLLLKEIDIEEMGDKDEEEK